MRVWLLVAKFRNALFAMLLRSVKWRSLITVLIDGPCTYAEDVSVSIVGATPQDVGFPFISGPHHDSDASFLSFLRRVCLAVALKLITVTHPVVALYHGVLCVYLFICFSPVNVSTVARLVPRRSEVAACLARRAAAGPSGRAGVLVSPMAATPGSLEVAVAPSPGAPDP